MTYIVQKGDTLYGISKQFGVSLLELMEVNGLIDSNLTIGMSLIIPQEESEEYIVQKGDTLYSISKKYNIPVADLIQMNSLTSLVLSIGQVLKLNSEDVSTYTVQKGDTLYSIAKKFGMSVSDLMEINSLTSSSLKVGQVLLLKKESSDSIPIGSSCYGNFLEVEYYTYTVQRGDTLYSIAKKYGVSVSSIQQLNSLKSTSLSIGQVLKIKEVS